MNADPMRAGSGGEDDSWHTLAEDLFGVDLGAKPGDAQISPEDLLLDEPAPGSTSTPSTGKPTGDSPQPTHDRGTSQPRREPERPGRSGSGRPESARSETRRPAPDSGRSSRAQRTPPPADDDFGADLDLEAPFGGSREPEAETPSEEF